MEKNGLNKEHNSTEDATVATSPPKTHPGTRRMEKVLHPRRATPLLALLPKSHYSSPSSARASYHEPYRTLQAPQNRTPRGGVEGLSHVPPWRSSAPTRQRRTPSGHSRGGGASPDRIGSPSLLLLDLGGFVGGERRQGFRFRSEMAIRSLEHLRVKKAFALDSQQWPASWAGL